VLARLVAVQVLHQVLGWQPVGASLRPTAPGAPGGTWCHDGPMAAPPSQPEARNRVSGTDPRATLQPLDAAMRDQIAATLAAAKEQVVQDLAQLTGNYDELVAVAHLSNADDEHDSEGATIASERSQLEALVRAAKDRLVEIDAAATRLEEGSYGVCESCGRPISPARLEARPVARTCIDCAAR
jgi:DnaK suppressor protein